MRSDKLKFVGRTPEQASADQFRFREMLQRTGVMVQQFVPEVQTHGEWSFIFFEGRYSHAVLKRASQEDFRVQDEYGGYLDSASPSDALIEKAGKVFNLVDAELLFARVDGIERNGEFYLMELELIEPFLYLGRDPLAAERFGEAIITAVESGRVAKAKLIAGARDRCYKRSDTSLLL